MTGDFAIAGYTASKAAGGLGALIVAQWVDGELVYRGKVGTGFDVATMSDLLARLERLRDGGVKLEGGAQRRDLGASPCSPPTSTTPTSPPTARCATPCSRACARPNAAATATAPAQSGW